MLQKIINFFKLDISGNRVFGLDLLRCIAILLVLLTHFIESVKANNLTHFYYKYLYIDGVSLFFVLSGFLIGSIMIKDFLNKGISFSTLFNFWKRRWFRTLPNYYLVMFCVLLFNYTILDIDISIGDVIRRITFTQNFFHLDKDYYQKFPEAWSLAVEEWFYLLIPLFISTYLYIFNKAKLITAIWLTSFLILFSITSYRIYLEFLLNKKINTHLVIIRLDAILYGVIGATIAYYHSTFWKYIKIPALIFSILAFFTSKFVLAESKSFSLILDSIAVLCTLPFLSQLKLKHYTPLTSFITWISLISYSMYLLNLFIIDNIINPYTYLYNNKNSIKFFLFFGTCFLLSTLLYKYFEVPIIKWRDRITRK